MTPNYFRISQVVLPLVAQYRTVWGIPNGCDYGDKHHQVVGSIREPAVLDTNNGHTQA